MAEAPPPKRVASLLGYRWCPHCNSYVAERTYRSHRADYFPDGTLVEREQSVSQSASFANSYTQDTTCTEVSQMSDTIMYHQDEDDPQESLEQDDTTKSSILDEEDRRFFDSGDSSAEPSSDQETSSGEEYESSSELEIAAEYSDECISNTDSGHPQVGMLHRSIVIFLCLWQSIFTISDAAIVILLKFLVVVLNALVGKSPENLSTQLAQKLPQSVYMLRKYAGVAEKDGFLEYVILPACYSLYTMEDCLIVDADGETLPKKCSHVKFPNHPLPYYRKVCGSQLLTKVNLSNGKVEYRPKFIYAYQPIKYSLQRLLLRPGFCAKLESWRNRCCSENVLSDVYDGNLWKEFSSEKYEYFLTFKRNYGVMLNFDFFQPYKHTTDSYGALYLTLMNLPRSERFKQENVLLVGIIPPFDHEPTSINTFLRPLIDELKEFWHSGVRLTTAESPKYKLLFKVALMCVACDIPAARKCCGFKGHSANHGCSRCMKLFPGGFGKKDFSGFDRSNWPPRTLEIHREVSSKLLNAKTQTEIDSIEMESGVKYSELSKLPYFNQIRFTIIDPMHNLFLGTAKTVMKKIWLEKNVISQRQLNVIQCRVDSLNVPSDIGRIPKKIASNFSGFIAEQLKNWVIIYSMYALMRDALSR